MTDDDQDRARIPASDTRRLLELLRGADSAELKISVPAGAQRATIRSLGIDPIEAQIRQVFFFDTQELTLNQAGVVVRARRIQGGKGDTVVKLRPVDPSGLPDEVRRSAAFNVEVDALPGAFVCSGTMKGKITAEEVKDVIAGRLPLRKLLTKEQREFYRAHAPDGLEFDALVPLGPTFVLKAVIAPGELGRSLVAEMWLYPDGARILELSTKCDPAEAFQVAAEARAFLADHGIPVSSEQQTKTKTALAFYAKELGAAAS